MHTTPRLFGFVVASLVATLALGSAAHAATPEQKCRSTIIKEAGKFVAAKAKALQKCEEAIVKGLAGYTSPPGARCNDSANKTDAKIAKAETNFKAKVDGACGGADKVCNAGGDDIALASIGWSIGQCPDFELKGCDNPIKHCGGVGSDGKGLTDCLLCMNEKAIDQAMDLYANGLQSGEFGTASAINKCQAAIAKETTKFLLAKSKVLGKCWDAVNGQKPGFTAPCPSGDSSGKTQAAIDKAESGKIAKLCKACGGTDKACDLTVGPVIGSGNSDDFTPAAIGFAAKCPDVTLPVAPNTNCGTLDDVDNSPDTIDSLRELILCVDCVTEFKEDCIDRATVPGLASYPSGCNVCADSPPTGACPTTVQVTTNGVDSDLDSGWTGISHDFKVPTQGRLSLNVSGCSNANHPCGQCNVSGPITNVGGVEFNNHRCRDASWVQCTTNTDCTNAGAVGPCTYFFGAPLPLSAGAVPVCVTNEVNGAVTGTINVENGTTVASVKLLSRPHTGGTVERPCPTCDPGPCAGGYCCSSGPRATQACTVNGESALFGALSFDCPPDAGSQAGTLPITLPVSTGLQTATLSAASPDCRALGYESRKCFCDTCNNANADPCMTDADCPDNPPSTPGICGGKRCRGGGDNGEPCVDGSTCDTSNCDAGGVDTAPNACSNGICRLNPADTDSVGEAQCTLGPNDNLCSKDTFLACVSNSDCNPPNCSICQSGQTCTIKRRQCFADNGVIGTHCFRGTNNEEPCTTLADCPDQVSPGVFCGGGSASVQGTADVPCGTRAKPRIASIFCIPHSGSSSVNITGGLPGLGRLTLGTTTVFDP